MANAIRQYEIPEPDYQEANTADWWDTPDFTEDFDNAVHQSRYEEKESY